MFQTFNLLSRASALGNVELPMIYAGLSKEVRKRRARQALQLVGLGSRLDHQSAQLSGGQQQRVTIARALVTSPSLLLADEPTGNLDSRTSVEVMAILQALHQQGLTIVLVTREPDIAAYATRQVSFRDGRLVRDEPVTTPRDAQADFNKLCDAAASIVSVQRQCTCGIAAVRHTPPQTPVVLGPLGTHKQIVVLFFPHRYFLAQVHRLQDNASNNYHQSYYRTDKYLLS